MNSKNKFSNIIKNNLHYTIISVLALVHFLITFITDKKIFTVPASSNILDYSICKILTYVALWFFYYMLYLVFIDRNRKQNLITRILISALPYLVIIIGITFIKLRGGYLSNDENLIYQNAITLTHYTWFYYITTYFYIIALMLIPHMYAPIFIKLFLEYVVIGYVVVRCRDYFKSKSNDSFINKPVKIAYGSLIFILFILYPVIAYTTSAHRLPIYFFLYLFMIVTLLFDKLEGATLTKKKAFWLLFLGSLLTQWRTEGIYLAVLIPILLLLAYGNLTNNKKTRIKSIVMMLACYIVLQYIVSIPQNGLVANDMGAAADDRMKPFYAYTITNMYRNGLDMNKNADDLAIVDKYMSLDAIAAINEYFGDINYEDVLILYQEGFIGVREEADVAEFYDYAEALKRIFKNNPDVFIKTRIGAFCYAALPFHISYTGMGAKSLVSFLVSVVKTVSYNLFIPLTVAVILCLYSLFRKRWFTFFTMGGLLAHWFIVFILAPASYFKYYFPVYIVAYFYVILLIIQALYNRKHSTKVSFIR